MLMEGNAKLAQLLRDREEQILSEAAKDLKSARLVHYSASNDAENEERLNRLYTLTLECIAQKQCVKLADYARAIARERFAQGFDLQEVQAAMNALENAIWQQIIASLPAIDYPDAFGLTSTILGAGKEALAAEYVSLAAREHAPSLNVEELFKGT